MPRTLVLGMLVASGCARVDVGGLPDAETIEPLVRVGLALDVADLSVGGGSALVISGADGGGIHLVPEGATAEVAAAPGGLTLRVGRVGPTVAPRMTVRPTDSTGFVRLDGREFRGDLTLSATATGLLAVNAVSLERYVAGVVNAEMGRRPVADREAMRAQAVVSRTVAARALGRYRVRGYDLVATVADQAYGGVAAETDLGWEAVRATRGEVVSFEGRVIEAFFHSTCGGRSAAVEEAFSGDAQPYLRSIADRDAAGQAYCSLSPRFRWREEWTAEALTHGLREGGRVSRLPLALALAPSDLQITARTPSGRVAEIVLLSGARTFPIGGQQAIRQVLRPPAGGLLRSTQFAIQVSRAGGRITRLRIDGSGNGHGVGMCQWGAVGRARAGFSYRGILGAYFPGTDIRRLY